MTVYEMRDRLAAEFPDWSNVEVWTCAVRLTGLAAEMAAELTAEFKASVEADLAALPVVGA